MCVLCVESDAREKDEERDGDDKPRSIRDRRRPREKRRSTGVSYWTLDVREIRLKTFTFVPWINDVQTQKPHLKLICYCAARHWPSSAY